MDDIMFICLIGSILLLLMFISVFINGLHTDSCEMECAKEGYGLKEIQYNKGLKCVCDLETKIMEVSQ